MRLILGDCLEKLKDLPDNSVSSVVCDPPYGLSFMSKKWDYDVPSTEIWQECLRVLKPGGHLLAFSGSRTYHRMAVRIEDAGFEIRDQIMWLYGSGFPKSHNIGKAIDKLLGNEREVVGERIADDITGGNFVTSKPDKIIEITKGKSEWEGWGTALKPSHEPIVVARKPLSEKSVAENVLKWGTGGLNIDVSRIGTEQIKSTYGGFTPALNDGRDLEDRKDWIDDSKVDGKFNTVTHEGRWPANIILDEEAGAVLDEQSGISGGGKTVKQNRKRKGFMISGSVDNIQEANSPDNYGDKGGASRFFYCAKASKKDRDEGLDGFEEKLTGHKGNERCKNCNKQKSSGSPCVCENPDFEKIEPKPQKNVHPTVKPTSLMEYLIKLVTPVNGTVLDPFMGSGSTGKAAVRNGFDFIGIEREEEYINIAKARIENENKII
jgi:DNA modification methylase